MYNGHRSKAAWNVALWLFNDEPLYREMVACVASSRTLDRAAERLFERLPEFTPDGYRYTKTTVRAAISNWER